MKSLITLLALVSASSALACENQQVVYSCRIGKFAEFQLVKVTAEGVVGYELNEREATRDRSGPGIYTKDVHTLLATYGAENFAISEQELATKEYKWSFDGQGGPSKVSLIAKDGDENGKRIYLALGKGSGPVYEGLKREWKEYVLGRNENGSEAPTGFILCSPGSQE